MPRRSKHPLLTGHTRRESIVLIRSTEQSVAKSVCEKRLNNGYETRQTTFDSMVGHIGKLKCYKHHRIYEMLPLNVTVETPATTMII